MTHMLQPMECSYHTLSVARAPSRSFFCGNRHGRDEKRRTDRSDVCEKPWPFSANAGRLAFGARFHETNCGRLKLNAEAARWRIEPAGTTTRGIEPDVNLDHYWSFCCYFLFGEILKRDSRRLGTWLDRIYFKTIYCWLWYLGNGNWSEK